MSLFSDAFNSTTRLRCSCGAHETQSAHDAALSTEAIGSRAVEQAVVRAMFPDEATFARGFRETMIRMAQGESIRDQMTKERASAEDAASGETPPSRSRDGSTRRGRRDSSAASPSASAR